METNRELRRAIVQAQESNDGFGFYGFEIVAAAIGAGYIYHNWLLGGGVFIGGIILIMIPYIRGILAFGLSALWGLFGYVLGIAFFSDTKAGYTIGGITFLITLGLHLEAIQRASDTDPTI